MAQSRQGKIRGHRKLESAEADDELKCSGGEENREGLR
jgi:hypothetical protein